MCECTMLSSGEFSPITIKENKLKFSYTDKFGFSRTLIEEFDMDMVITKASVSKVTDSNGKVISYKFEVW